MARCVIVIPVYRPIITPTEQASLRQCLRLLGKYPIVFVGPQTMDYSRYKHEVVDASVLRFPDSNFSSVAAYSKLLLTQKFYRYFADFRYMLLYQLDAYVFSNALEYWCEQNYAYVGAPWFKGMNKPLPSREFLGVGNGGFSLRKVSSFLRALRCFRFLRSPLSVFRESLWWHGRSRAPQAIIDASIRNCTWTLASSFRGGEDMFWGLECPTIFRWFRVPTPEIAMRFAFEVDTSFLYEKTLGQLPFGCHAWEKYDRTFWEPFIQLIDCEDGSHS